MRSGTSFVITKKVRRRAPKTCLLLSTRPLAISQLTAYAQGLNATAEKHGFDGDGFSYLQNPTWWAGMVTSERYRSLAQGTFTDSMQWSWGKSSILPPTPLRLQF